jgi:peptidyl-prolyl cis-trans isomerase D
MMTLLRKHRHWLMVVIAILALPFCVYFVRTDYGALRGGQFAQIYGRSVSLDEVRRDARLFGLARALGMIDFLQDLTAGAKTQDEVSGQFTLNLIVLRHEAERLGIRPAQSEVVDAVRNFPAFRGDSGFDAKKYDEFAQNLLSPNGFTDAQIEELARDQTCLNRIKELVATAISVPESESKAEYEQLYGKLFVSVIRLRTADFTKDLNVTDDDVRKYYETHATELKTEEKRKVEFVRPGLNDEQKKLKDKERIEALQKLADRANDFTQALLEKGADFRQVAPKFQLPIQTTGEFAATQPDPQLNVDPQLSQAAFQLTVTEPNSDPIQVVDGFYVLHLASIVEARPLTLEEAKPKIVDSLKAARARELVASKSAKVVHDLRESLKTGEPFSRAYEQAGVKAEKIEPFILAEDLDPKDAADKAKNQPADLSTIKNAVAQIQPGEVSDFLPSSDGGIIAVLEKRELPDAAKYQQSKAEFEERVLRNKREMVFYEWLRDRQLAAGILSEKSETSPPPPVRKS